MPFRILTVLLSVTPLVCHGTLIGIAEAPWQASVLVYDKHRCGGVIYSKDIVITNAQCVRGAGEDNLAVRVGSDWQDLGGQVVPVRRVTLQALGMRPSDVAILALGKSLDLGDVVQAIELADWSPETETEASVTGWADVVDEEFSQKMLVRADLVIVENSECRGDFLIKRILTADELCGSASNSTNLVCQGFSGGPLVSDGKLIGIGAWYSKCDFLHSPSVYSNIPMIQLWIRSTIQLMIFYN